MRLGNNPQKNQPHQDDDFLHQVIIPVYLPHSSGYFADGFTILQYCLESLFKTIHSKTFITIVNNGSSDEIRDYLDRLNEQRLIHEVIHTTNVGKLNAVLKGIAGHNFPYITVSDADVLFLNHWQKESYRIFDNFPKVGAVCPTPSSKSYKIHTENIWFDLLFSRSMRFTPVKNPGAMRSFAESIDNPAFYNEVHLSKYLTVENFGVRAVVGAGHFAVTYKNEVFESFPVKHHSIKLGGERDIIDRPVLKRGLWRLSTEDNYAYHMGNVIEDWMQPKLDALEPVPSESVKITQHKKRPVSLILLFVKNELFKKFIFQKNILRWMLRRKGLTEEEVKRY